MLGASGVAALAGLGYGVFQPNRYRTIPGQLLGPSAAVGHQLREHHDFPKPSQIVATDVLIIGGGISGLSAAWWLQKQGLSDYLLLELEKQVGGNARSGQNQVSAYPWGAHYVPLPSEESQYVRMLFEEFGVIQGYADSGLPIYNELYLCHDPDERLFKDGRWQDGLVPVRGARFEDHEDINRFFALIKRYKEMRGTDGKRTFAIPIDHSSQDAEFLALDRLSMKDWLAQEKFRSPLLNWYVNYCCRDDYGAPMELVSAWAGLHYFAARDGLAANAPAQAVLTWPEGNGWLVNQLKACVHPNIRTQSVVYQLKNTADGVVALMLDTKTGQSVQVNARQAIFAGPRFVAQHIMPNLPFSVPIKNMEYSPWLVANLTLKKLPMDGEGVPLAWDNVGYYDQSLGYVVATHQDITLFPTKTVITYYRPLDHADPRQARREAYQKSYSDWLPMILADLKSMHPHIEADIEHIDVWVWGHGMIRPKVGYIWGDSRQDLLKPCGNIHFAHTDMSGISIFEEAQYRGIEAAKQVLKQLGNAI